MTKVLIPVDQASFERLREQARAAAGKASAPKPPPADQVRKSSPAEPTPGLEGPGPKAPADPRPKAAAPASSSDSGRRERPARAEGPPELEPEGPDLVDLFHGARR